MTAPEIPDRPAGRLDAAAVALAPVWRFLLDDEATDPEADESWVRACEHPPALGEYASYMVRATYELDDGLRLPGLVQVDLLGSEITCTPCTLFAGGAALDPMAADTPRRLSRRLGTAEVRPLRWRLDVTIDGQSEPHGENLPRSGLMHALGLGLQLMRLRRMKRGR